MGCTVYDPVQAAGLVAVEVNDRAVAEEFNAYAVGDVQAYPLALQLDVSDAKLLASESS